MDGKRVKIDTGNFKVERVHYTTNAIDKKCGGFFGRQNKIKSSQKVLDKISINIVINFVFEEEWILHLT